MTLVPTCGTTLVGEVFDPPELCGSPQAKGPLAWACAGRIREGAEREGEDLTSESEPTRPPVCHD